MTINCKRWTKLNITYKPTLFEPPPKDLTEANCIEADGFSFLSGGLLMATLIVLSPIIIPSVFTNACAAAA
jgi:hypothetical protein